MSNDPATFVAGVPVKIGERFRPPRKVTLPASCNHTVNVELLIAEYDSVCEKSTLTWIEEKRKRREVEQKERKERIAQYEKEKADRIAKEKEEEERRLEEERERQLKIREEEEERERIRKEEEERRIKEDEERKRIEEEEIQRKMQEEAERRIEEEKQRLEEEEKRRERLKDQETGIDNEDSENKLVRGNSCNKDSVTSVEDETAGTESSDITNQKETQLSQATLASNLPVNPIIQQGNVSQLPSNHSQPLNLGNDYQLGSKNYAQNGYITPSTLNTGGSQNRNVLQPTLVHSQKQQNNIHNPHSINFADFEGQGSDPFDSAALKSINDMEELAKVLQGSSVQQDQSTNSEANTSGPPTNNYVNNQVNPSYIYGPQQFSGYGQPGMKQQQQQQHHHQQQQHQQVMYGGYGGTPVTSSQGQGNSTLSSSVGSYSSTTQYHGTSGGTSYVSGYYNPQLWNSSYGTNGQKNTQQYAPYNYRMQTDTVNSGVSHHGGAAGAQGSLGNAGAIASISTISPATTASGVTPTVATPGKRQDLEDFYSKYYSRSQNNTTNMHQSGNRSVESTPGQSVAHGDVTGTGSGSMRSSRSVPDLTAEDDAEVSGFNNYRMSVSNGSQRAFSHTPPPRPPSTTINGLEDWKPLPDLNSSNKEGPTIPQYGNTSIPTSKYGLPDPFTELNSEAQGLVTSMAEMGFPRSRVARAVQKLGTDHKKLLEVLLTLQKLQEQGEDEYRSELAFYHYLGDIDKTKDHLAKTKQLQDLGFAEDRIIDALFRHSNNTDKALEELIT